MQKTFGEELLKKALEIMADKDPRYEFNLYKILILSCRLHICAAVVNLFSDLAEEHRNDFRKVSVNYEQQIISSLLSLMKIEDEGHKIQRSAITAFASLCEFVGNTFNQ